MRGPVNVQDYQRLAKRRWPRLVYDFVAGGAEDEITVAANERAYREMTLHPRYLVDVAKRSQNLTALGDPISLPVILGPTGLARLAHRDGELAVARAAGECGTVYVGSIAGSETIEDVARQATGPLWFQLYLWRDRDLVESIVERAANAGYRALVLTIDVPVVGRRERDLRNGMSLPPRFPLSRIVDTALHLRWLAGYLGGPALTYANLSDGARGRSAFSLAEYVNTELANPGATWEWLTWLKQIWKGPVAVKGVMTAADALLAVEHGADGVIVSNHGGRQLDGVPATIDVLPEVVAAVDGWAEVFVDGGIRRGSDVFKALALGATACFVARPYWYGLAAGGAAGVRGVVEMFRQELDRTQALMGAPTIEAVHDQSWVRRGAVR